MAITAIVASIVGFTFIAIILSKSQKYFIARQKELGKINGHIEEVYSGHNVIKSYNAVGQVTKEFDDLNESLYTCNRKSQFLSGLMGPIMGFVSNLGYVAVCVVGAILTMNGTINFEVIVAFMVYIRLFSQPLSQIAQAFATLQQTSASSSRVFTFLDEIEVDDESNKNRGAHPAAQNGARTDAEAACRTHPCQRQGGIQMGARKRLPRYFSAGSAGGGARDGYRCFAHG